MYGHAVSDSVSTQVSPVELSVFEHAWLKILAKLSCQRSLSKSTTLLSCERLSKIRGRKGVQAQERDDTAWSCASVTGLYMSLLSREGTQIPAA